MHAPSRSFSLGRSTSSLRGKRRMRASSRSNGRFVAPMTITFSFLLSSPSISCINSVNIERCPSRSRSPLRWEKSASSSSTKTMQGVRRRASEKIASTTFSDSPTRQCRISDGLSNNMCAPASRASARTTCVFPVPGGPKRRLPRMPCSRRMP
ncbi:hypothetical protein K488DRAFT_62573 [Vararia minispora EC-137]|uniref:Uncharacterized protein n=1 Tax=Vararia minispora EC-137 TaxID=1314806 RepID=A0ACB8Q6X8_9AGAM|nr:hypothetical protein K488DRAFT_62573 [Vararia minispora EC-137]